MVKCLMEYLKLLKCSYLISLVEKLVEVVSIKKFSFKSHIFFYSK